MDRLTTPYHRPGSEPGGSYWNTLGHGDSGVEPEPCSIVGTASSARNVHNGIICMGEVSTCYYYFLEFDSH